MKQKKLLIFLPIVLVVAVASVLLGISLSKVKTSFQADDIVMGCQQVREIKFSGTGIRFVEYDIGENDCVEDLSNFYIRSKDKSGNAEVTFSVVFRNNEKAEYKIQIVVEKEAEELPQQPETPGENTGNTPGEGEQSSGGSESSGDENHEGSSGQDSQDKEGSGSSEEENQGNQESENPGGQGGEGSDHQGEASDGNQGGDKSKNDPQNNPGSSTNPQNPDQSQPGKDDDKSDEETRAPEIEIGSTGRYATFEGMTIHVSKATKIMCQLFVENCEVSDLNFVGDGGVKNLTLNEDLQNGSEFVSLMFDFTGAGNIYIFFQDKLLATIVVLPQ